MSPSRSRRLVPRRRFHALHADVLLVMLVAGMLASSLPSFRPLCEPTSGWRPFRVSFFAPAPSRPDSDDPFNPEWMTFGSGALPPVPDVPPPDAAVDALRPLPLTVPAFAAPEPIDDLGLPVAAMRSSLSPAPPLFSRPSPQQPAAPARPPSGTVTLFQDAESVLPTVIVDAPDASPELVRSVEKAALARRSAPSATSTVVRLPVSQFLSAPAR